MEKYLINENAEVAEMHIVNVEKAFISPLMKLADGIKRLGIGNVTKDLLKDAIVNNGKVIRAMFDKVNNADDIKDERLAQVAQNVGYEKMRVFDEALAIFKEPSFIFDGTRINNPKLLDWVDVTEDGEIIFIEDAQKAIRNDVKVYVKTKTGKDLYDLHHKIAKELQLLYDEMDKMMHTSGMKVADGVCYASDETYYPLGLFDKSVDRNGKFTITPRLINFDMEKIEDDVIDDED